MLFGTSSHFLSFARRKAVMSLNLRSARVRDSIQDSIVKGSESWFSNRTESYRSFLLPYSSRSHHSFMHAISMQKMCAVVHSVCIHYIWMAHVIWLKVERKWEESWRRKSESSFFFSFSGIASVFFCIHKHKKAHSHKVGIEFSLEWNVIHWFWKFAFYHVLIFTGIATFRKCNGVQSYTLSFTFPPLLSCLSCCLVLSRLNANVMYQLPVFFNCLLWVFQLCNLM